MSGLKWSYDADAPFGDRFGTLTHGINRVDTGIDLVETMVHYLEHHPLVDPQVEGRLTVQSPDTTTMTWPPPRSDAAASG